MATLRSLCLRVMTLGGSDQNNAQVIEKQPQVLSKPPISVHAQMCFHSVRRVS